MKKTFQLSVIAVAIMAGNAYADPIIGTVNGTAGANTIAISGAANWVDANNDYGIAIGRGNDIDNNSITYGYENWSKGKNSFTAGSVNNATASDNSIAVGYDTRVLNDSSNSTAIGINIDVHASNSVLIGHDSTMTGERATGIGNNNNTNAENATSFGQLSWATQKNATSVGTESWANAENATTLGYNVETGYAGATGVGWETDAYENAAAIGKRSIVIKDGAALGANTITNDANSVALGYNSDTFDLIGGSNGVVTVGAVEGSAFTRNISQVATGIEDTDAINLAQLNDALGNVGLNQAFFDDLDAKLALQRQDLNEKKRDLSESRIAGDAAQRAALNTAINTEKDARIAGDAANRAELIRQATRLDGRIDAEAAERTAEVARLDGRINHAAKRLNDFEKNAYRGVAIALAAQQAVPNIRSGQVALFAGVGHFEGETAGSLGLVTSLLSNRISISGSVGYAGGDEVGSRVGLSYSF